MRLEFRMSFSGLRVAGSALAVSFVLLGLAFAPVATAQDTASEPMTAEASVLPEAATPVDDNTQSAETSDPQEIDLIRTGFDTLRLMAYVAFAVGLAGGLVLYWY